MARKVREALAAPEPRPYTRTKDPPAPKLGPFKPIIDELLQVDEVAPRKLRHANVRVFQRLQGEHGYAGSYGQVHRYVAGHRRNRRETFIPLLDRLTHRCHIFEMNGESFRFRESVKAGKENSRVPVPKKDK